MLTLNRCFHEVFNALFILHKHIVKLPSPQRPLDSQIADDIKYASYFKDCISALDGTHIHSFILAASYMPYRN